MSAFRGIEVVVFDVLATLIDENGGLTKQVRAAVPDFDDVTAQESVEEWERYVALEQQRIAHGQRAYVDSRVIDTEAAQHIAERSGITERTVIAPLATAGQRWPPWAESAAELARIVRTFPVVGLSNASSSALLRLSAYAGLRWHQALSAETVSAYKPAPEVYRLAIETAGCPPDRVLMVAAHAWDLRGAQAAGMRTAFVQRPRADTPAETDRFDAQFDELADLRTALVAID